VVLKLEGWDGTKNHISVLRESHTSLGLGRILWINGLSDMRFGTWNARSLCRAGSVLTVSKELLEYWLHLVGMQEDRWEGGRTEPVVEYTFFYGKGNENLELGTGFLCIRESHQLLRGLSLLVIGCHT
jgi:hypothetical protein